MQYADMRPTAWITGAGKGIGRATALHLAHAGWKIAASARTEEDLASLQAAAPPGTVATYPLDITDPEATKRVIQDVEAECGPIELALMNAGTHKPVSANAFSADIFRFLVETNIMGTVYGIEAVLPHMQRRKRGNIAIVASVAGYRGLPTAAAYGCTKAGLINMAEALKPELDQLGIKLQLINPGFVETPLTDRNEFTMPFLMSPENAASRIVKGLSSDRFEICFPIRFAVMMKLLRICPNRLFFWLTRRLVSSS